METKTCTKCHEAKPCTLEFFYKGKKGKGFRAECKVCVNKYNADWSKRNVAKRSKHTLKCRNRNEEAKQAHRNRSKKWAGDNTRKKRDYYLRSTYGITVDDYENMLDAQNNQCAICGRTPAEEGKYLAVDHCHKTGNIRGILCQNCNQVLGKVKDTPNTLYKAAAYLEKNESDSSRKSTDNCEES